MNEPVPERGQILRATVGIGLYAAAFGMTFGAVSVGAGLSLAQTSALSLVLFSGASQFAFVGVVGAGGSAWTALGPALLLAVRNGFYGVSLVSILAPLGLRRPLTAHFVIDETTAMAVAQTDRRAQRFAFWATGLVLFSCWQLGTLAGGLVGAVVDPAQLGLDAAAPAVFLALLWPALRRVRARWVAMGGAAVALVLLPVVPGGVPVLTAAAVAVLGGLVPERREETQP